MTHEDDCRELRKEVAEVRRELSDKIDLLRDRIAEEVKNRDRQMAVVNIKAGAWGAALSLLPALSVLIYWLLAHFQGGR